MELGTDIIEIERIERLIQRHPRMVEDILTPGEMALFENYQEQRQAEFLSGRFCAKEAYVKALGTGFRNQLRPIDIEILPDQWGRPVVTKGPITEGVSMSISHSKTVATATCIMVQTLEELHECLMKKGISL